MYIRITFPVHGVIKVMGYRNSRSYPVRTTLHNYRTVPPRVLKSIGRRSQQSWLAAQEMGRRYVARRAEIRMAATSTETYWSAFGTCVRPMALSFVYTYEVQQHSRHIDGSFFVYCIPFVPKLQNSADLRYKITCS